ncbi:nitrilase-related carbon-nitrogen hydrolase [Aeromicrobium sp. UC242_57]|uniref:nitrilase-related carbon-nitrogen hydrolase n=1 Tax=Aeromicrobium sp. UC242_57 TaxID=3374624 RepID=UPI0037B02FCA
MTLTSTDPIVRVAAGQIGSVPGEADKNTIRTLEVMAEAHDRGVQLLVMPECGLTGYVFETAAESRAAAVTLDGPEVRRIAEAADGSRSTS